MKTTPAKQARGRKPKLPFGTCDLRTCDYFGELIRKRGRYYCPKHAGARTATREKKLRHEMREAIALCDERAYERAKGELDRLLEARTAKRKRGDASDHSKSRNRVARAGRQMPVARLTRLVAKWRQEADKWEKQDWRDPAQEMVIRRCSDELDAVLKGSPPQPTP